MSALERLSRGNPVWNFALYVQDQPFTLDTRLEKPVKLFSSRRIKLSSRHPRHQADPFLIAHEGMLYVFYEELLQRGVGRIACARTADLSRFERLGVILSEPHHLSYPFVFRHGADVLLLPESSSSGEVPLYAFDQFPFRPRKLRSLVSGAYKDSCVVKKDGLWYLFTTSDSGFEIFFSEDLREGEFRPHPMNPVVTDRRYCRSGGGPLLIDGAFVRVAQDGSQDYGTNVSLIAVEQLSPESYAERILVTDFFQRRDSWNKLGAHHLSVTQFNGKTVIAADGKGRDFAVNKLLSRFPTYV